MIVKMMREKEKNRKGKITTEIVEMSENSEREKGIRRRQRAREVKEEATERMFLM